MKLQEIKQAVNDGKTVCWKSEIYVVEREGTEDYYQIHCTTNDNYMGLTWLDGKTMNGEPEEFFILDPFNG